VAGDDRLLISRLKQSRLAWPCSVGREATIG
jgi:hypothetical protein